MSCLFKSNITFKNIRNNSLLKENYNIIGINMEFPILIRFSENTTKIELLIKKYMTNKQLIE